MKRKIFTGALILYSLISFSQLFAQSNYTGKLVAKTVTHLEDATVVAELYALEMEGINYIINLRNFNEQHGPDYDWVQTYKELIINGIEYELGDSVKIYGSIFSWYDDYINETVWEIEIETIENLIPSYSQNLFPLDNARWIEAILFYNPDGSIRSESYCAYSLQGDTVIDNIARGKLYYTPDIDQTYSELIGYIHTDQGKVYLRQEESDSQVFQWRESIDFDIVMYDFTLEVGSFFCPFELNSYMPLYEVERIDSVLLGNETRKRLCLLFEFSSLEYYWIEGMGSTLRFLETRERLTYEVLYGLYGNDWYKHFPTDKDVYEKRLIHFYLNDEIVWSHPDYPAGIIVGVTAPAADASVHIYPNVLGDESLVVSSTSLQQIQIYDVSGRLVLNYKVNGKTYQYPLYKQSLKQGIYYVKVRLQNGLSEVKHLIVK